MIINCVLPPHILLAIAFAIFDDPFRSSSIVAPNVYSNPDEMPNKILLFVMNGLIAIVIIVTSFISSDANELASRTSVSFLKSIQLCHLINVIYIYAVVDMMINVFFTPTRPFLFALVFA